MRTLLSRWVLYASRIVLSLYRVFIGSTDASADSFSLLESKVSRKQVATFEFCGTLRMHPLRATVWVRLKSLSKLTREVDAPVLVAT